MVRIGVPYHDILRIGNVHALHIFPCKFGHKLVRESRCVVLVERKRNMSYDLGLFGPCLSLEIKTADHVLYTPGIYSVVVEHTGVSALFEQVAHGPAERLTRYYFCDHRNIPLYISSTFRKTRSA